MEKQKPIVRAISNQESKKPFLKKCTVQSTARVQYHCIRVYFPPCFAAQRWIITEIPQTLNWFQETCVSRFHQSATPPQFRLTSSHPVFPLNDVTKVDQLRPCMRCLPNPMHHVRARGSDWDSLLMYFGAWRRAIASRNTRRA